MELSDTQLLLAVMGGAFTIIGTLVGSVRYFLREKIKKVNDMPTAKDVTEAVKKVDTMVPGKKFDKLVEDMNKLSTDLNLVLKTYIDPDKCRACKAGIDASIDSKILAVSKQLDDTVGPIRKDHHALHEDMNKKLDALDININDLSMQVGILIGRNKREN